MDLRDSARTARAGASLDGGTLVEYCIDVTDRRRAEQERELLSRELSHRVKSTLAVIRARAVQTNDSSSVQGHREKFLGWLSALARAHTMLLDAQCRGADLKELAREALQVFRVDQPDRIAVDGGSVQLSPGQSLGLSLILHELATNAAEYGALAQPNGRLRVSWRTEDRDRGRHVRLRWEETGGRDIGPPTKKGFGMRLIERACAHELGGAVELNYAPEGLSCEGAFPLD